MLFARKSPINVTLGALCYGVGLGMGECPFLEKSKESIAHLLIYLWVLKSHVQTCHI